MGVNIIKSRHVAPHQLITRGLKLIFLGYALSALRFFIPIILGQHFGLIANPDNIIYKFNPIYYLLQVDILQVAGLSLITIALLKWQRVKYDYYLVLAFIVALLAPFLVQINISGFFQYFLDPFWGGRSLCSFSVFPLGFLSFGWCLFW